MESVGLKAEDAPDRKTWKNAIKKHSGDPWEEPEEEKKKSSVSTHLILDAEAITYYVDHFM